MRTQCYEIFVVHFYHENFVEASEADDDIFFITGLIFLSKKIFYFLSGIRIHYRGIYF